MRLLRYNKKFFSEEDDGPSLSGMVGGGAAIAGAGLGATALGYNQLSKRSFEKAKLADRTGALDGVAYKDFYKNLGDKTKAAREGLEKKITNMNSRINEGLKGGYITENSSLVELTKKDIGQLHDKISTVAKDTASNVVKETAQGNKTMAEQLEKSISRRRTAGKLGKWGAVVGGIGLGMYGLSKLGGKKKSGEKNYSVLEKNFGVAANTTREVVNEGKKKISGKVTAALRDWWNNSSSLEKVGVIGGGSAVTGITGGAILGASGAK